MTDLHCHILPCVDDGASNTSEALELLEQEAAQGIDTVCLTPHLRGHMFHTPDTELLQAYGRFRTAAEQLPIRLYLSREYYYDDGFRRLLGSGQLLPMGNQRVLLVEFSYTAPFRVLAEAAEEVLQAGYRPMFAHVERYAPIQEMPELVRKLIDMGVTIQVNANSVIGKDGWTIRRVSRRLLKLGLVHVIASDAHDPVHRAVNLEKCSAWLTRKFGREYAQRLMTENPNEILLSPSENGGFSWQAADPVQ